MTFFLLMGSAGGMRDWLFGWLLLVGYLDWLLYMIL